VVTTQPQHANAPQPRTARTPQPARGQAMALREIAVARPYGFLQAKLAIGPPNDRFEQEADAAADRVVRMSDPQVLLSSGPALSRKCEGCENEEMEEQPLRRDAAGGGVDGSVAPPIVHDVLNSPGRPLDPVTHDFMAPRFGADFREVRIHTDDSAAHSAAAVGARAYTVGHNIVFGAGHYDPAGHAGRRLLAHELAHVVQQREMAASAHAPSATVQRQGSGAATPAPEAEAAVRHARTILSAGNILFDSWGNDVRDNDNDGVVDTDRGESNSWDGQHFRGTYTNFGLVAGVYQRGWPDPVTGVVTGTVTVPTTRTITGTFRYRVCADVVSQAYADAGLMRPMRATSQIIGQFRRIGTVWHGRSTFPSEYLPGDFVATYSAGHGGHSGVVTTGGPTSTAPTVIELPGPSTQADAGTYDPASTNDVKEQSWSKQGVADGLQYLGRYTGRRRRGRH
jgi:hypothetical protein